MISRKFGVVGYGVVGVHMEQDIARAGFDSEIYDPRMGDTRQAVNKECQVAFVCVPTPQAQDGSADLSAIDRKSVV